MKKIVFVISVIFYVLPLQAQEKYLMTSDDVRLYVNIKGQGTPCLYIHGGPGSGSYWMEKFFGDFLEQHFTMIYLDQRGVGRSSSPEDQNYSIARMDKDFEEVREALGFQSWVTLGHSFGGILQTDYAKQYPKAIKGMIMVNCTLNMKESFCKSWIPKAYECLDLQNTISCSEEREQVLDKLMDVIGKLDEKELTWKITYSYQKNNELVEATYDEIPDWNNDFSSLAFGINDYWKNFKEITSQIEQPVLYFSGNSDWAVGPEHYRGVNFPHMILWKSDVGHMPFMENKADLEKAITTYISENNF